MAAEKPIDAQTLELMIGLIARDRLKPIEGLLAWMLGSYVHALSMDDFEVSPGSGTTWGRLFLQCPHRSKHVDPADPAVYETVFIPVTEDPGPWIANQETHPCPTCGAMLGFEELRLEPEWIGEVIEVTHDGRHVDDVMEAVWVKIARP